MRPKLVAHVICAAEGQRQHVGNVIDTELLSLDGGEREIDQEGVAVRRAFDDVLSTIARLQGLQVIRKGGALPAAPRAFKGGVVLHAAVVGFGGVPQGPTAGEQVF